MGKVSGKAVAASVAVAGAVGFLVGILFAPKSGKETRKDIKNAAVTAKAELEKRLKEAHSELNKVVKEAKAFYDKSSKSVKKELGELIESAKLTQNKVRDLLSSLHDGVADDPELKAAIKEATAAKDHLATYLKTKKS